MSLGGDSTLSMVAICVPECITIVLLVGLKSLTGILCPVGATMALATITVLLLSVLSSTSHVPFVAVQELSAVVSISLYGGRCTLSMRELGWAWYPRLYGRYWQYTR